MFHATSQMQVPAGGSQRLPTSSPRSAEPSTQQVGGTQGIFHWQREDKMSQFYFSGFCNLGQIFLFLFMTKMNTWSWEKWVLCRAKCKIMVFIYKEKRSKSADSTRMSEHIRHHTEKKNATQPCSPLHWRMGRTPALHCFSVSLALLRERPPGRDLL